jgi:hypothetical protein
MKNGYKKVTNWQRMVIHTVYNSPSRAQAANELNLTLAGLNDLLYRAYKVLDVKNLKEAYEHLSELNDSYVKHS